MPVLNDILGAQGSPRGVLVVGEAKIRSGALLARPLLDRPWTVNAIPNYFPAFQEKRTTLVSVYILGWSLESFVEIKVCALNDRWDDALILPNAAIRLPEPEAGRCPEAKKGRKSSQAADRIVSNNKVCGTYRRIFVFFDHLIYVEYSGLAVFVYLARIIILIWDWSIKALTL